jgi:hypothetical protein
LRLLPQIRYVRKWTGSGWSTIGSGIFIITTEGDIALALDSSNNPIVAFTYKTTVNPPGRVQVRRRTGSSWQNLGSTLTIPGPSTTGSTPGGFPIKLTLIANQPVIAFWSYRWGINVQRWTGTGWQSLGVVNTYGSTKVFDIASLNSQPLVSYASCELSPGGRVYVIRYNGSIWPSIGGTPVATFSDTCTFDGDIGTSVVANQQNGNVTVTYGSPFQILTSIYK